MTDHSKGKALFAEGNYAGAAEAFSQAINSNPDSKEAALLYSNQAECMLKMNNNQAAAAFCEKSLQLDPYNAKSYNRLARALPKDDSKAALSICSAIALCGNQVHGSLISLYKSIQQEASHKDWMPLDHRRIRLINPGTPLPFQSSFETSVWILSPGSFDIIHTNVVTNSSLAVIGLGKVTIRCKMGHIFRANRQSQILVLHNLTLIGDNGHSAVCCSDGAQLKMSNCSITEDLNGEYKTEDLRRISCTALSFSSQSYYPIGNSVGFNLMDKFTHDSEDTLNLFFGACGDVRNLIATVAAIPDSVSKTSITLNDKNLTMLARNVVLLYLSVNSSPDVVLAVWANHGLTEFQGEELFKALSKLASSTEEWPEWLVVNPGHSEGYSECLIEIFQAWLGSKLSLTEILQKRHSFMGKHLPAIIDTSVAINGPCYRKDIEHYTKTGSLATAEKIPLVIANVTMMLAPTMQYAVDRTSSIFRVVEWPKSAKHSKDLNLGEAEKVISAALYPQIVCTAKSLSAQRVNIRLVPGDIVSLLANERSELVAPNNIAFDFMDCTNVVDYVGLATIVQLCAPLLKKTSTSRLSFESMAAFRKWKWEHDDSFLHHMLLGLPLHCFEQLTGLRVVSNHIFFPKLTSAAYIRLLWAPCDDTIYPQQAKEDLEKLVTKYGRKVLSKRAHIRKVYMPTPLSVVHLICRSFPEKSLEIFSNIMSTEDISLFNMEVKMHAMIQLNKTPDLVVCSYVINFNYCSRTIALNETDPLVLVLCPLPSENEIIENISWLISAFSWGGSMVLGSMALARDGSMGVARFLFPRLLKENCNWYITLGAFSSAGILAIGTSVLFSSLLTTEAENTNIWRK